MNPWIAKLLGLVVKAVSPEIKTGAAELLDRLEAQAKKTANPFDDILVEMLKDIMGGK